MKAFINTPWNNDSDKPDAPPRVSYLLVIAGIVLLILVVRLWYLQIVQGGYYMSLSQHNATRSDRLRPPRGIITDRKGQPIAKVVMIDVIYLIPSEANKNPSIVDKIAQLLAVKPEEIKATLSASKTGLYKPVPIAYNPTPEQLSKIMEQLAWLNGITVTREPIREYIHGPLWAHAVGYVGLINNDDLDKDKDHPYDTSDYVGRTGIEATCEKLLRGVPGSNVYETDARGRRTKPVKADDPIPGKRLVLTFDERIQLAGMKALNGRKGAVVAIDPKTGEVLAMVSSPTFDPTIFTRRITSDEWNALQNNDATPMYNRAIGTALAPGSTYKIVTAIAGLQCGQLSANSGTLCTGELYLDKWRFGCHAVHGSVDFVSAMSKSCDIFFYRAGIAMGVEQLAKTSRECGLGQKTGIDLPMESSGLIPDPEWKKQRYKGKDPWYPGDTVLMSMGQGFVTATPIQMANIAALVANRGVVYKPHTVLRAYQGDTVIQEYKPEPLYSVDLKPGQWDLIIRGLVSATNEGTAKKVAIPGISIASKTGSAEERKGAKTHAWYIGYAPADNPQIAICVLVEEAGHGGDVAAPIARDVFMAFFNKNIQAKSGTN